MDRHRTAIAAVLAGLLCPASASAQPPQPRSTLTSAISSGKLQFRISSGRIEVVALRSSNRSSSMSGLSRREKTTLRVVNGTPTLSHESSDPKEELTVQLTSGNQISITRQGKGETTIVRVLFSQAPNQPARLQLGPEDRQRVYQGATIWHLLISEPKLCREHLIPLLQLFRPDWKLAEAATAVEEELLRMVSGDELPDHRRWSTLVEQLADEQFAQREAADRQLRTGGRAVLSYLRGLDFQSLDAEQKFRVRRIIRSLSGDRSDDTPSRAARTLSADPVIWLALLSRPDESTRRLALQQLNSLLGSKVPFDPAADEATREEQIERLRKRIVNPGED